MLRNERANWPGELRCGEAATTSRRLRRFAVYSSLATAAMLAVLVTVTGCPQPPPVDRAPLRREGVPTIRVRISSSASMRVSITGGYRVLADSRIVASSTDHLPPAQLTRNGRVWSIHGASYVADRLVLEALGRSFVRLGPTSYRGSVVFLPDPEDGILAVNHIDTESYLAGVLGRELYPDWSLTTYKAQAIAARTYALYEQATFGPQYPYDLRDDQSSQVYGGFSAETDKAWRAVRETHGIALAAGPQGKEKIFRAHYSACCGGMTNSVYVLYGPRVDSGPLGGGVVCEDCRACRHYRWSPVRVHKDVIHRALGRCYQQVAALRKVEAIEVVEDMSGRPVWINVVGSAGQKVRIRADDLRLALLRDRTSGVRGLKSMNCRIRDSGRSIVFELGRGFGHGVGLCQWGAEEKARQGMAVEQILETYYPGAKLFQAYP
jgi:stage II sporulation protein D